MNRDDDKPDLIHLTDLAIDWRFDSGDAAERPGRIGGLSRLWVFLFGGKAASSEPGIDGDTGGPAPPRPDPPTAE